MVMYGKLGEGYMEYSILFLYFFVSLKLLENELKIQYYMLQGFWKKLAA